MAVAFTRSDLLTDISDKELTALTTKLVVSGDPDPLATAIERGRGAIDLYAGRWLLPVDWEKRLICAIALWEMVARVGVIEDKRQKAYEEAMKTLRDVRYVKFPNLTERSPLPVTVSPPRGGSGSASVRDFGQFSTGNPFPP